MSVGILLAGILLVALFLTLFWRVIGAILGAPARYMRHRRLRRRERGYRSLTLGMVAVAAGDADEARRQARRADALLKDPPLTRSEEHTSELQSLMRISYAAFCLKKKQTQQI